MCRKIMHHRMPHDVRTPMMLVDPNGGSVSARLFANPLRTSYHRCEIPPRDIDSSEKCDYHSCCVPLTETRLCAEALGASLGAAGGVEPEECERFVLEHRHHRLVVPAAPSPEPTSRSPTLSLASSCSYDPEEDFADDDSWHYQHQEHPPSHPQNQQHYHHQQQKQQPYEPTWRADLSDLAWRSDDGTLSSRHGGFAPLPPGRGFAHAARFRARFEEDLFAEAGSLHTLWRDAETHYAVMRDLQAAALFASRQPERPDQSGAPRRRCCWEAVALASARAAAAGMNFVRAREKMEGQRAAVANMLRWAGEPCLECR